MKKVTANDLLIGTKIKIGTKYAKDTTFKEGEIITLICGYFEEYNGLYDYTSTAPAIKDPQNDEFDSIFHLFGNDLENFLDCEIVGRDVCKHKNKSEYNEWSPTYCLNCNEIINDEKV